MNTPLPQLERLFVTDAGLETDLIYNRGVDLPCFASIMLLRSREGREILDEYFRSYLELARRLRLGCLLESASWRASADWAPKLGLTHEELGALNRASIEQLKALHAQYDSPATPVLVSGCIGPRGDGYDPGRLMTAEEAETYHGGQARMLASAGPDLLSAITMNNVPEAIGISRAAEKLGMPDGTSYRRSSCNVWRSTAAAGVECPFPTR
jgi:homocysteine S-methyltransferase